MSACWLFSLLAGLVLNGQSLPFFCSEPLQTSPSDELRCLFIDRRGMMWIGTDAGLKSYDGYALRPVSADVASALPSTTVLSITDDPDDNLWVGTRSGLARLDRRHGTSRTWSAPDFSEEEIYTLFTASDGTVWIGTDEGLSRYNAAEDCFTTYDAGNSWLLAPDGSRSRPAPFSVKSIVETRDGDLFIGTWSSGLLRFDPKGDTFMAYPAFNAAGSAFSLLLDSRDRLWIGTWGQGLFLIEDPQEWPSARIRCIVPARGNIRNFTRIVEDVAAGIVWAGDIDGICLFDMDRPDAGFRTCRDTGGTRRYPLRYCSDIVADPWGNVWLGMLYDGVFHVRTQASPFHTEQLLTPDSDHPRSSVSTLFTADGRQLWLGLLPYGLALQDRESGRIWYNRGIPGFAGIPEEVFRASVSAITRRDGGELWIGTKGDGLLVVPAPGRPDTRLTLDRVDFLAENYITALFTDRDGYSWVGQRTGLSLVAPDGSGQLLSIRVNGRDLSRCEVNGIAQDRRGTYWICTESQGILRIDGRPQDPRNFQFFQYDRANGRFVQDQATACLEGYDGALWAISNGGGLSRLDRIRDRFEAVGGLYRIPDARILAINEDSDHNLWLATDASLIRFRPAPESDESQVRRFSGEDGLGEILFSPNATFRYGGELFFGSRNGYFVYDGQPEASDGKPLRIAITDLSVDGVPYSGLPPAQRAAVSELAPMFTRRVDIPGTAREFSIDFSLLSHLQQHQTSYAYRLDGYDRDWHYLDDGHSATYQNLPPGTYQFQLRAASQGGRWNEMGYPLTIQVEPPGHITWRARLSYALLALIAALLAFFVYRRYLKPRLAGDAGISALADDSAPTPSPEDIFLQRATDCVLAHLEDGNYDREAFASDMCMSSSSLYNKLRAATGQNISGFVNSIRLREACRIAREQKGIRITELAERVGYNSARYFSMCFKKEFGVPPKEYLDQMD
ncbi:MAG: helix-turn-helix domain-containing protein [Bacteroidales bacterium]|nr:helix-turn-helix domain-containing protein [Bacteroidales bacterium]